MMKRSCPYDSSFHRMSKIHLMDHDVDKDALRKIQENTLNKLLQSSRNPLLAEPAGRRSAESLDGEHKQFKQVEVTKFFNIVSGRRSQRQLDNLPMHCQIVEQCFYCENKSLAIPCSSCLKYFCESCTFVRYDKNGEQYVCLSCS